MRIVSDGREGNAIAVSLKRMFWSGEGEKGSHVKICPFDPGVVWGKYWIFRCFVK